jgi:hypothetical protein
MRFGPPLPLVRCYVFQGIDHLAAELGVARPGLPPPPAFKGSWAEAPAVGEFVVVEGMTASNQMLRSLTNHFMNLQEKLPIH